MYRVLFVLFIPLFCTAQEVVNVRIDPRDITYGQEKLSDFAESIEYVPLETKEKCLIGRVSGFDISNNYILVACGKADVAYLFHRDGRFISRVGNQGGGPGEYLGSPASLFIDEKRGRIYIMAAYQRYLLVYDLKGKYLSTKPVDEKTAKGRYMRFHNNYFFKNTDNYSGNVPFVYEIRDFDLNLIKEAVKTVFYERRSSIITVIGSPHNYLFNNKIHTKELSLNDTIYSIEDDFSFSPKYTVNAGKYEVTTDLRAEGNGNVFLQRAKGYVSFRNFYETNNYLLLMYHYGEEVPHYGYFNKNTNKLLYLKSDSKNGFANDLDGGIDFWPERQDNDIWYSFYDAHRFVDEQEGKPKTAIKGSPQAIQGLKKLIDKLDPEDNPVLMIVKQKK